MVNFNDFQRKHIKPQDFGFVSADGDPGFDIDKHKRLMKSIIDNNARVSRDKKREYDKELQERTFAVGKYVENLKQGGGEQNVEKYFGKNYLNFLKGQELANKYKMAWTDAKKKKQSKETFIQSIKSGRNS